MDKENILIQELGKLELSELKKVAALWNLHKFTGKDKKTSVNQLYSSFQEEFYLKSILEKLTPIQVNIFSLILKNKNVQTLGEIVRKTSLHPINAETELGVPRKYCLVYQRKNRERLTNNLDKYHAYQEMADLIKLDLNSKGEKFKLALDKFVHKLPVDQISPEWSKALGYKKVDSPDEFFKFALSEEGIGLSIQSLNELERDVLLYVYTHGGIIEAEVVRNYINVNRGKFEQIIPDLTAKNLVIDT